MYCLVTLTVTVTVLLKPEINIYCFLCKKHLLTTQKQLTEEAKFEGRSESSTVFQQNKQDEIFQPNVYFKFLYLKLFFPHSCNANSNICSNIF